MSTIEPKPTETVTPAASKIEENSENFLIKTGTFLQKTWTRLEPKLQNLAESIANLPGTINETQTRRIGVHNIVLVIFCFTAFVLSFLVLSQDIEEVYDDPSESEYPMEISPFFELMDGYTAQYNEWFMEKRQMEK